MFDEEFDLWDEFVDSVKDEILLDESKTKLLDPLKMKQMQFVYAVLKRYAEGDNVKLNYSLNEPFSSMGSISIEGGDFIFHEPKWIARAMEFTSNVEVYPLADGRVRMTFTFHGLARPIE